MAIGDDHALLPAQRLHLLFDSGVQVADHGHDALDLLTVEVNDQAEHAMGRWVMGYEVDREQLAAERALLAGSRDRDARGGGLDHASSGAVCQISCSSENSTTSPPTG